MGIIIATIIILPIIFTYTMQFSWGLEEQRLYSKGLLGIVPTKQTLIFIVCNTDSYHY